MNALAQQIVTEAQAWVGVQENPPGSNSGPRINDWLTRVHMPRGNPWCAAFAWCMLDDALARLGLPNQLEPTASTHWLIQRAKNAGAWTDKPGVGFIGGIDKGAGRGHAIIVCEVDPDNQTLRTIEGNEGNKVTIRSRRIDEITLGYLDPGKLGINQ